MTVPIPATPGPSEWALPSTKGGEWAAPSIGGGEASASHPAAADPAGGFDAMLTKAVDRLEQTQQAADAQARALATGETEDITAVVAAVEEATLAMQLAAQIRNKAVEAYTEIFHTQV